MSWIGFQATCTMLKHLGLKKKNPLLPSLVIIVWKERMLKTDSNKEN